MILTNGKLAQKYRDENLWGTATLDGLVHQWAKENPHGTALVDLDQHLTWLELDQTINAYATHFLAQNLEPDDVVAVQLDNSVEMPIILLAIMRANLIATPLPPLWRHHEIITALSQVAPKAVVTKSRIGDVDHGMMMCEVAMKLFSIRLVMAFGDNVPDGVMDINEIAHTPTDNLDNIQTDRANPADHVATMCWWTDTDILPRPVARSHNHWIAASLPIVLEAQITGDEAILSAQYLTGLGSIATVIGPWLLSGSKLVLHQPFNEQTYQEICKAENATLAIIPAPVTDNLRDLYRDTDIRALICIWSDIYRARQDRLDGLNDPDLPVIDVCLLAEAALYVCKRDNINTLAQLPVGAYRQKLENGEELEFLETRIKGGIQHAGAKAPMLGGELLVRGPMVPSDSFGPAKQRAFKADPSFARPENDDNKLSDNFCPTGIVCAVSGTNPPMIEPVSADSAMANIGGLSVSLADLDQCVNRIDSIQDAAVFCVKDNLLGNRIYGAFVPEPGKALSLADVQRRLLEDGLARYKIPEKLIEVAIIPRLSDGTPDRDQLQDEM